MSRWTTAGVILVRALLSLGVLVGARIPVTTLLLEVFPPPPCHDVVRLLAVSPSCLLPGWYELVGFGIAAGFGVLTFLLTGSLLRRRAV